MAAVTAMTAEQPAAVATMPTKQPAAVAAMRAGTAAMAME
jgi:hypothetical protein